MSQNPTPVENDGLARPTIEVSVGNGVEQRTVVVQENQVFIYAPAGIPEDAALRDVMEKAAARIWGEIKKRQDQAIESAPEKLAFLPSQVVTEVLPG